MGIVGIIVNPAAGNDIRRLVSGASSTSDSVKVAIVRRAIVGAIEGGADRVLIAHDHKSIGYLALRGIDEPAVPVEIVGDEAVARSTHTQHMAAYLRSLGAGALVTLGGDGTHRDVAKGWRNAALLPVSTGTNNVYPRTIEATIAGHAAARAASGSAPLAQIAHRSKVLDVVGDGIDDDLALIDIALVDVDFIASRAIWDVAALRELIVTTAEPASIGLSAIAAKVTPVSRTEFGGVHVRFGPGRTVRAPIAPGLYQDVQIAAASRLTLRDPVTLTGPGVLAFDGERDLMMGQGQQVMVTLSATGPWVIDPAAAMTI